MRVAFFEDRLARQFTPIALLRPVFELLCGRYSARERGLRQTESNDWGVFVRKQLVDVYREDQPLAHVNDLKWLSSGSTLLVNGRWLAPKTAFDLVRDDDVGMIDDTIAYLTVSADEVATFAERPWDTVLADIAKARRPVPAEGEILSYPWDLISLNAKQLIRDFRPHRGLTSPADDSSQVALLGKREQIVIDASAIVDPFTVLDARSGPIVIDRDAVIRSFTRIEGPCYIAPQSELFRAHIRSGTTIGPQCRVGGEVEESILHGYVNSYHDGFLGHAYVCPWVNMGALTTNSDLKNDYSDVRIPLAGEMIDTGSTKVGCFIGDHAKTALASLFNTGTSVGVMSMVLPGGELLPKHIPSFSRIWHGELDDHLDLDANIRTARTVVTRRDCELTAAQEQLLRFVHQQTAVEREAAVLRSQEKKGRRTHPPLREAS